MVVLQVFFHLNALLSKDTTETRHNTTPSQSCTWEPINLSVSEGEGAEATGGLMAETALPMCGRPPLRGWGTASADPRCPRTKNPHLLRETGAPERVAVAKKKKRLSRSHGQGREAAAVPGQPYVSREPGGCCGVRRTFAPRRCSSPPDTEGGGNPARGEFTFTCRVLAREAGTEQQQQQQQQAHQAAPGEGGRHGAPAALPWLGPEPHPAGYTT